MTPEQVGLPAGTNRRVQGLRRSEVATLAGLSVEYYTRMERGAISEASPQELESIARALCVDDAERAHLFNLANAAGPVARPPRRRGSRPYVPHQSLQWYWMPSRPARRSLVTAGWACWQSMRWRGRFIRTATTCLVNLPTSPGSPFWISAPISSTRTGTFRRSHSRDPAERSRPGST